MESARNGATQINTLREALEWINNVNPANRDRDPIKTKCVFSSSSGTLPSSPFVLVINGNELEKY